MLALLLAFEPTLLSGLGELLVAIGEDGLVEPTGWYVQALSFNGSGWELASSANPGGSPLQLVEATPAGDNLWNIVVQANPEFSAATQDGLFLRLAAAVAEN